MKEKLIRYSALTFSVCLLAASVGVIFWITRDEQARLAARERAALLAAEQAYQSEAELYGDWSIPPLTQTLSSLEAEFTDTIFLKAEIHGRLVGSVRAKISAGRCAIGETRPAGESETCVEHRVDKRPAGAGDSTADPARPPGP